MDVLVATHAGESWSDQDDHVLVAALRHRGMTADVAAWDDPTVDWAAAGMVTLRSTWGYADHLEAFLDWADRVEAHTLLTNSAEVVRWNVRKDYLLTMEERGAPIVPTAWLGRGDRVDLADVLAEHGWADAIVKPVVGAGAIGLIHTARLSHDQAQDHLDGLLAVGDVMVQPFQSKVMTEGELSVILIDGEVTHAVRKLPAQGDIRVQLEYGGRYVRDEGDAQALALARWIVQATGHDLLYARVDLIAADDGAWQVGELELTEPSLYLTVVPEAAHTMAAAIELRLRHRPNQGDAAQD